MSYSSNRYTPLQVALALTALVAASSPAWAGTETAACQLTIRGHSIRQLTLVGKAASAAVRFQNPGGTVTLPPGEYRVAQVELEEGFSLVPLQGNWQGWFQVTAQGPNELVVGAPLYPTVTARRHGGVIQMDYATVDGAGRVYQKAGISRTDRKTPPKFKIYQGGKEIGAGSFKYG